MHKDRQRTTEAGAAAAATRVQDLADALAAAAPNVNEHERRVAVSLLAIPEMDHRFHAEGGKPIYAWCALDPFLIVPVIGRAAHVESRDAITGEPITMTVTPDGVEDLSPPLGRGVVPRSRRALRPGRHSELLPLRAYLHITRLGRSLGL